MFRYEYAVEERAHYIVDNEKGLFYRIKEKDLEQHPGLRPYIELTKNGIEFNPLTLNTFLKKMGHLHEEKGRIPVKPVKADIYIGPQVEEEVDETNYI